MDFYSHPHLSLPMNSWYKVFVNISIHFYIGTDYCLPLQKLQILCIAQGQSQELVQGGAVIFFLKYLSTMNILIQKIIVYEVYVCIFFFFGRGRGSGQVPSPDHT